MYQFIHLPRPAHRTRPGALLGRKTCLDTPPRRVIPRVVIQFVCVTRPPLPPRPPSRLRSPPPIRLLLSAPPPSPPLPAPPRPSLRTVGVFRAKISLMYECSRQVSPGLFVIRPGYLRRRGPARRCLRPRACNGVAVVPSLTSAGLGLGSLRRSLRRSLRPYFCR